MSLLEYHSEWLPHDGKIVVIDGKDYTISVRTYKAIFPFDHIAIEAYAERGNESIDLIDSCDDELFASIDSQLGGIYD